MADTRPLAVVTGASTGIGYELAKVCAENGFDLVIGADEPEINDAAERLRQTGVHVDAVQADLATPEGCEEFCAVALSKSRPVDALLANAGRGLGGAFLDQNFEDARNVIETNITGELQIIHKIGKEMRARGSGRILITGSIAGFIPGSFQAVYNGTKAFLDNFSFALRNELKDSGVTVSCLMPGPTDTEFFRRAGMLDTKVGSTQKDDAAEVARIGFDAMMKGEGDVVTGLKNKIESTVANITPAEALAERHRKQAQPGTAKT
ncbi:MAG TPA: SDR family NAD(P)-dependent oxidoreductase [Methylovirgula sp.]|nr:SDR family NAD(P)-dependent oxidoreductase [Methylovirgula sp.]